MLEKSTLLWNKNLQKDWSKLCKKNTRKNILWRQVTAKKI